MTALYLVSAWVGVSIVASLILGRVCGVNKLRMGALEDTTERRQMMIQAERR